MKFKSNDNVGYNSRWQRARLQFLNLNPLCCYCDKQGKVKPANIVDHIKPHKGDYNLFWDESNWQAMCKECHDGIKDREERKGYNDICDQDGYPIDPKHPSNR